MRYNKIIGWDTFLNVVERVQKVSPWLSRQLTKHASEWPFWYSGLVIRDWADRHVRVHMAPSARNALDGEITQGHLLLGAELATRLLLLRYREEFPFKYRLTSSQVEVHHAATQDVEYRFGLELTEWEHIRLSLAKDSRFETEFVFPAYLADGRAVATFTIRAAFTLEKYLSAY